MPSKRCKRCGKERVRKSIRTLSVSTEGTGDTATVYFHETTKLTLNGVTRQYQVSEQAVMDYAIIRMLLLAYPSSPVIGFVYPDQEKAYYDYYS